MKPNLTRDDSALLKGLAILGIMLHNFCHLLPGMAMENEYTFHSANTWSLLEAFRQGHHVFLNLLSYFGHYGVPIFLFVSGYGLVMKYERGRTETVSTGSFLLHHAVKLWKLLALGLLLWAASEFLVQGLPFTAAKALDLAGILTYTVNLFPHPHLHMLLGPWWFFGLIMQLYLVYRLFIYRRSIWLLAALTLLCVAVQFLCIAFDDKGQTLLNYERYNFTGAMLPFALGIVMARFGILRSRLLSAVSLVLFLLCCFNVWAWTFAPLFLVVFFLQAVELKGFLRDLLGSIGFLSPFIFVVHPIVRPYFLRWATGGGNIYLALLGYLAAAMLLAVVYREINNRIFRK